MAYITVESHHACANQFDPFADTGRIDIDLQSPERSRKEIQTQQPHIVARATIAETTFATKKLNLVQVKFSVSVNFDSYYCSMSP